MRIAQTALIVLSLAIVTLPARAALVISTDATAHVSCTQGQYARVCNATAANAVLNVTKLSNLLAAQNVNVATGSATDDIVINAPLSWTSASGLALIAQRSIVVNAHVSDAGTGTELNLEMGSGGHLSFGPQGNIGFFDTSSLLVINNQGYQLVNSVPGLATWVGNNAAGYYALAASYDATPDGTYAHAPIQPIFSGIFEGLGNTVSSLTIDDTTAGDNVGLFAYISGGTVENVRLTKASVQATGNSSAFSTVGGLVGINRGTLFGDSVAGRVTGSYAYAGGLAGGQGPGFTSHASAAVTVKLTGGGNAGGLIGYQVNGSASVDHSHASGKVTGGDGMNVGGLIGSNTEPVETSYATGDASGGVNAYVGGLVGINWGGSIKKSYATGSATTGASSGNLRSTAGGLVGELDSSTISQSWAAGAVTAAGTDGGGLTGASFGAIDNSYATGSVTSGSDAGGLAGYNASTISAAYSTGAPQGASGITGGLLGGDGAQAGSLTHTYWDTTTSGITDPAQGSGYPASDPGIAPKTTSQLRAGLPAGFKPGIWGEKSTVNNGLPYLLAIPPG